MAFFVFTKVLIKSLFKRPYTVKYPYGSRIYHGDISRGSIVMDIEKCISCGLCEKKCPVQAIQVSKDKGAWSIDKFRCIICGCCVEICPKKCLFMDKDYTKPMLKNKLEVYTKCTNTTP